MKNYILPLVFTLLLSCTEEDSQVASDPFVGSWSLENTDLDLKVSFDVSQDGNGLSFHKINIEYPEITETLDYRMEPEGRFAVNAGYEQIKIFGIGDQQWITLIMDHNRVHLETRDELDVYNLRIEMINRVPIELQDQVFTKLR